MSQSRGIRAARIRRMVLSQLTYRLEEELNGDELIFKEVNEAVTNEDEELAVQEQILSIIHMLGTME